MQQYNGAIEAIVVNLILGGKVKLDQNLFVRVTAAYDDAVYSTYRFGSFTGKFELLLSSLYLPQEQGPRAERVRTASHRLRVDCCGTIHPVGSALRDVRGTRERFLARFEMFAAGRAPIGI